jgi:NAD(P)-dependent dehydrogenase (short-subunit alcohol dehydrogenase family)
MFEVVAGAWGSPATVLAAACFFCAAVAALLVLGGRYTPPSKEDAHWPAFRATLPRLDGRTVAITGTTSGTGFVAAQALAEQGATVLLLNRPSSRADASLSALRMAVPGGKLQAVACDLMDLASVRAAAAEVAKACPDGLDVLANNAGVMGLKDDRTVDDFDVQSQTNVLSGFLLTQLLMPALSKAAAKRGEARVVQQTSVARVGASIDAKFFAKGTAGKLGGNNGHMFLGGGQWERYHQTKMANLSLTYALGDRLAAKGSKVIALCAHPGVASTNLTATSVESGGMAGGFASNFMKFSQSQRDGSIGLVRAIASPGAANKDFYGPSGGLIGWLSRGQLAFAGPAVELPLDARCNSEGNKQTIWRACEDAVGVLRL